MKEKKVEMTKGEVTLRGVEADGSPGVRKIEAEIYGHLAITQAWKQQGYRITHIPTGWKLDERFHKTETARKALLRILLLIDWSFTDPATVTPEQRHKVHAALARR